MSGLKCRMELVGLSVCFHVLRCPKSVTTVRHTCHWSLPVLPSLRSHRVAQWTSQRSVSRPSPWSWTTSVSHLNSPRSFRPYMFLFIPSSPSRYFFVETSRLLPGRSETLDWCPPYTYDGSTPFPRTLSSPPCQGLKCPTPLRHTSHRSPSLSGGFQQDVSRRVLSGLSRMLALDFSSLTKIQLTRVLFRASTSCRRLGRRSRFKCPWFKCHGSSVRFH